MNMYSPVICLLAFAVAVYGSAIPYMPISTIKTIPNSDYSFKYAVNDPHTGDNKAQWESRHGDVVKGAYSLVEPDGNIRLVEYHADPHTGFNAVVKRTGPTIHSHPLPVIHAPMIAKHIAPVISPIHEPILPESGPWVHLSGHTSEHGHITHGWNAGPISLDGKVLSITTKHH